MYPIQYLHYIYHKLIFPQLHTGVTSFDIDFAAKKLTVVGNVTPLAVLASVSKVKNAQLLTLPPSSAPTATTCSETKGNVGVV